MMDWARMGKQIKKAREQKGLTQEQLAERVDLSVQHVSVIERGVKAPKLETFVKIANELQVNADFLLMDYLSVSSELESSELHRMIEKVSGKEQKRILAVAKLLIETAE